MFSKVKPSRNNRDRVSVDDPSRIFFRERRRPGVHPHRVTPPGEAGLHRPKSRAHANIIDVVACASTLGSRNAHEVMVYVP